MVIKVNTYMYDNFRLYNTDLNNLGNKDSEVKA